jgi:hypothetical protein
MAWRFATIWKKATTLLVIICDLEKGVKLSWKRESVVECVDSHCTRKCKLKYLDYFLILKLSWQCKNEATTTTKLRTPRSCFRKRMKGMFHHFSTSPKPI